MNRQDRYVDITTLFPTKDGTTEVFALFSNVGRANMHISNMIAMFPC